jgi:hypothetical protein
MQANIPTQDSYVYENILIRTNSDSDILAIVEKANQVDFLEEDYSTSVGCMKIKI